MLYHALSTEEEKINLKKRLYILQSTKRSGIEQIQKIALCGNGKILFNTGFCKNGNYGAIRIIKGITGYKTGQTIEDKEEAEYIHNHAKIDYEIFFPNIETVEVLKDQLDHLIKAFKESE